MTRHILVAVELLLCLGAGLSAQHVIAAESAAASVKVLRVGRQLSNPGPIDPAQVNSISGANIIENIFEPMLQYDYLARPLKLVPNTLVAMPVVSAGGLIYVCQLKRGILFAPDPAFKDKPRELTAADYAYSIRRLFDPRYLSSQFFMVDGKIAGANALRDAALAGKPFDYEKPIAGLTVLDRYTLRITLTKPDFNFGYVLAHNGNAIVAREVVEKYPNDVQSHPVGSSAYYLKEWVRGQRMVLEKNPYWRGGTWDFKASGKNPYDETIVTAMKGKPIAVIDRVEIYPIEEEQTRWLAFKNVQLDILNMPQSFIKHLYKEQLKA